MDLATKINISGSKLMSHGEGKPDCLLMEEKIPWYFRKIDKIDINQLGYPITLLIDCLNEDNFSKLSKKREKFYDLHRQRCARCRDEWEERQKQGF